MFFDDSCHLFPEIFFPYVSDCLKYESFLVKQKSGDEYACGITYCKFVEKDIDGGVGDSPFAREAEDLFIFIGLGKLLYIYFIIL